MSNTYSFQPNYRNTSYSYNYHNRGPVNTPNTRSTVNNETKPTATGSGKFFDQEVKAGTECIVVTSYNKEYYSIGKVESINPSTTFIKFTTLEGTEESLAFHNTDGTSYLKNGFYNAYPVDGEVVSTTKDDKLVNLNDFKNEKKSQQTESETTPESTTETTQTNQARAIRMTQDMEQEASLKEVSGVTKPRSYSAEEAIEPVSYKNYNLDAKERYMGMNVEEENDYWGYTMKDIVNMPAQKRFEFFLDNPEIAFMMFQDAVEYVSLDDDDFQEENIEFYDGTEDETTAATQASGVVH